MMMQQWLSALRHKMLTWLPPGSHVIVAVSGGPDSQLLLDVIGRSQALLGWGRLWAVGIDHGLRAAARTELQQAAIRAHVYDIAFITECVHVRATGNLLDEARQARYAALETTARRLGAGAVLLGHTATDQTETVLHHLCRGTKLRGAGGMPERCGLLVRPMLHVTRRQVTEYLERHSIARAQDPSNLSPSRMRGHLRLQVLPALEQLNNRYDAHVAAFAQQAQADDAFLSQLAAMRLQQSERGNGWLGAAAFADAPAPVGQRLLRRWLAEQGMNEVAPHLITRIWESRTQTYFKVDQRSFCLIMDRGKLWYIVPATTAAPVNLVVPGNVDLPALNVRLLAQETIENFARFAISRPTDAESVAFDADRLHFALMVRTWQSKDRVHPFGRRAHVRVSSLLSDAKVPLPLRHRWPVVTHGSDILWVVGVRRGSIAPITAKTRRVITVKLNQKLDGALFDSA